MIVVLQRVSSASVSVDGSCIAEIGRGLCLLVGAVVGDDAAEALWLADKIAELRAFADADGKTNLSLADVDGAVLLVPQFTLAADWRHGRRPSFTRAAPPDTARSLLAVLAGQLRARGVPVAEGAFGAEMAVALVNAGPWTLVLDSRQRVADTAPGGTRTS